MQIVIDGSIIKTRSGFSKDRRLIEKRASALGAHCCKQFFFSSLFIENLSKSQSATFDYYTAIAKFYTYTYSEYKNLKVVIWRLTSTR